MDLVHWIFQKRQPTDAEVCAKWHKEGRNIWFIVVTGSCPERPGNKISCLPLKSTKKEDPGNNRLVSLTPFPGNVVEKLVLKSISGRLRRRKWSEGEHGFTKKSCLISLMKVCDEVTDPGGEGGTVSRWGERRGCCPPGLQQGHWLCPTSDPPNKGVDTGVLQCIPTTPTPEQVFLY